MIFLADSESPLTATLQEASSYNYWSEFVNMLITLFFIVGLIFLSVFILKKIMRSRLSHLNSSTGIKILERRALSPKSSLYLIDILGKGVLISDSAAGINLIAELPKEVNLELLLEEKSQETKKETFAQKMRRLSFKYKNKAMDPSLKKSDQ